MALPEQMLGNTANATVFNTGGLATTSDTIQKAMKGLSDVYRDPIWPSNPEFDPRARRTSGAGGVKQYSNLYRGYITQLKKEFHEIPGSGGKKRRSVNFQYNPTTISMNCSINTDAFPSQSRATDDTSPILATSGQTISFTLYFNRTYEVLTGDKKVGVLADIQSLEYLMGTFDNRGMAATECMVCFGETKSGKPIAFAGWISDVNIEILQFTHRMIPTVAMCQIGMARRFYAEDTSTATQGATNYAVDIAGAANNPNNNGGWTKTGGVSAGPRVSSGGGGGVPIR